MTRITVDYLRRLFAYDASSNRTLMPLVREVFEPNDRPAVVFAHIVRALDLWVRRLNDTYSGREVIWDAADWKVVEAQISRNLADVNAFLDGSTDTSLTTPVAYRNTRGEHFESTPIDILHHVIIHGGYHRGQVARALREHGVDPPPTDFIRWVRE
jgi:uncharacterized damage-inducible protein DinB